METTRVNTRETMEKKIGRVIRQRFPVKREGEVYVIEGWFSKFVSVAYDEYEAGECLFLRMAGAMRNESTNEGFRVVCSRRESAERVVEDMGRMANEMQAYMFGVYTSVVKNSGQEVFEYRVSGGEAMTLGEAIEHADLRATLMKTPDPGADNRHYAVELPYTLGNTDGRLYYGRAG